MKLKFPYTYVCIQRKLTALLMQSGRKSLELRNLGSNSAQLPSNSVLVKLLSLAGPQYPFCKMKTVNPAFQGS